MIHLDSKKVQATINAFVTALTTGTDQARAVLSEHLAPDVEWPVLTMNYRGRDAVLTLMKEKINPDLYLNGTWREYVIHDYAIHVYADFVDNKLLLALYLGLQVDEQVRITRINMVPRHPEPEVERLIEPLKGGDLAPDFVLRDVRGDEVALDAHGSRATVLVWTCNHCPFALGWHERIQDVIQDYEAKGVRVLQINSNDREASPMDSHDRMAVRVDNGEFSGPYLIDDNQEVAKQYGARHTPEIFVIDATGRIAYHGAPDADSERPELRAEWLRAALDAVIEGNPPALGSTEPVGCTVKYTIES